jgi:Flp pilus assembly protein CpaB
MALPHPRSTRGDSRLLAIGLFATLAVAAIIVLVVSSKQTPAPVAATPTTAVVVTAQPIHAGDAIVPADVTLAQRPIDQIPSGAYTNVQSAVGRYAAISLPADVPLTAGMTLSAPAAASPAAVPSGAPFTNIPPGDVAMSIPVTAVTGVAGYIEAGDHIDIIAQVSGTAHYVAQDVPVLAVSGGAAPTSATAAAAPVSANLLVVELSRYEAEQLSLILNPPSGVDAGVLEYVLRPSSVSYNNANPSATPEVLPSTPGAQPSPTLDPGVSPQQLSSAFAS